MATSLVQKLQVKPGQRMAVLNPPAGYLGKLASELAGVDVATEVAGQTEAVLLFVNSLVEVSQWVDTGIRAVKPGGLFWIAYPKGTSRVKTDVNRDRLWEAVQPTGWRPVRQVALDDVWSAMRFRPAEEVGR